MNNKKNILFLQGPIGDLFKSLEREFIKLGHNTFYINLWGGDYFYNPNGISYTGTLDEWQKYISSFIIKNKITDLILFGDRRAYHEKAIEACCQINSETNIWVLEEGYLRPHWITLDKYGANFRTSINTENLDENITDYKEEHLEYKSNTNWIREIIPDIIKYYLSGIILNYTMFSKFKYHRIQHPLIEMSGWIIKWIGTQTGIKNDQAKILKAMGKMNNHFVLALQLETDAQVRMYSPFKNMYDLMFHTMSSFKNFAPKETNLIIKTHPLDVQWIKRESDFKKISKELGIENRVEFIDSCNAPIYLNNTKGLITINSSLALHALDKNIPVIALGKAFWNIRGITSDKDLDSFWSNPLPPERNKFLSLKKEILKTQINGNFYSKEGRNVLIPKIIQHILEEEQDTNLLTEKVIKRIKENNKSRINKRAFFQPQKLDLKV